MECQVCQNRTAVQLYTCAECNSAVYCGEACQRADWAKHALICDPIDSLTRPFTKLVDFFKNIKFSKKDEPALEETRDLLDFADSLKLYVKTKKKPVPKFNRNEKITAKVIKGSPTLRKLLGESSFLAMLELLWQGYEEYNENRSKQLVEKLKKVAKSQKHLDYMWCVAKEYDGEETQAQECGVALLELL